MCVTEHLIYLSIIIYCTTKTVIAYTNQHKLEMKWKLHIKSNIFINNKVYICWNCDAKFYFFFVIYIFISVWFVDMDCLVFVETFFFKTSLVLCFSMAYSIFYLYLFVFTFFFCLLEHCF